MSQDLLYEIGVEEMPAGAIVPALAQLEQAIATGLQARRLEYQGITTYGAPRRLVAYVRAIADRQSDSEVEAKGPPASKAFDANGRPTRAAEGFARSQGVDVRDLQARETDRGAFVFVTKREQGRPAAEVLPELLAEATANLSFPKMLRWGEGEHRFGRPVRWLVALLGQTVLNLELMGVRAGACSRGHRVLGSACVPVTCPADYLSTLEASFVLADHHARRQAIVAAAHAAATELGGVPRLDPALVDEVSFLVEWPVAMVGRFDERYLRLPPEVVVKVMQGHQKYIPVEDTSGRLRPGFIAIINNDPPDHAEIRRGNEWVIVGRLEDAEFYYEQDLKTPFADRVLQLDAVSFVEGMGTLGDKTRRLVELVRALGAGRVCAEELAVAERAALLAKCDQTTMMIGDTKLGELQGVVGAHYARLAGEPEAVATAIAEQYQPAGPDDSPPVTASGRLLALADKLDNLATFHRLGQLPTGSADPNALRRQAQATLEILIAAGWRVDLPAVVARAISLLPEPQPSGRAAARVLEPDAAARALLELLTQRLDAWLTAHGISYDIARAALGAHWTDPLDVLGRARFLAALREDAEAFDTLVIAGERPARISRPADLPPDASANPALFDHPTETALLEAWLRASEAVEAALAEPEPAYERAAEALAALAEPIHRYFADVMVMVDDERVRSNRLALLRQVDALFQRMADFLEVVRPG